MIRGSLILLVLAFFAVFWHGTNFTPKTVPSIDLAKITQTIYPEQRFLLTGPANINTATIEELEAIPFIGPSMAKKIADFRGSHGRIADAQELLEIKGIGPRILERIKPYFVYGTGNTAGHL